MIVPILIHTPGDPNGIVGPTGYSSPGPQWVAGQSALPYIVNFQNEPTASAPATQVVVTEPVPADIDPNSVQLTGFGFGASTSVNIPAGQQSFSQQFTNLNLPNGDYLDVSGVYDPQAAGGANGVITWTFSTIDPSTGDLDSAVNAGFLPPDDAAGDGEGFVSWTGSAKSGLTTGTTITGQASIVFDRNAAISTPVWTNTIDATAPTASVTPLPATSTAGNLNVSWSGSDGTGSGVANYDLYESTDGGPLTLILQGTTLTSTQVPIVAGDTYGFAVDATDNVGNQGTAPTAAQTDTEAVAPPGATTTSLGLSSPSVTFGAEKSETFSWHGHRRDRQRISRGDGDRPKRRHPAVQRDATGRQRRQCQLQLQPDQRVGAGGLGHCLPDHGDVRSGDDLVVDFDVQLHDVDVDTGAEPHRQRFDVDGVDDDQPQRSDLARHLWRRNSRDVQWHGHRAQRRRLPGGHRHALRRLDPGGALRRDSAHRQR